MNKILFSIPTSPFDSITNEPLKEFRLFQYGINPAFHFDIGDHDVPFDQNEANAMMAKWVESNRDIMIDYDHMSLSGFPGEKPAAGWAKLSLKEDGIYATVEWTPTGYNRLKNKEYRYFSPSVMVDAKTDKMTEMLPIALTNTPALKDIPALMNSLTTPSKAVNNSSKDLHMNDEPKKVETFSATDMSKAIAEIEQLKAEKQELLVNALLDTATKEGKLPPAKRNEFASIAKKAGIETLELMLSALPTIAMKSVVEDKPSELKAEKQELSALEKNVCAKRGLTAEQYQAEKAKVAHLFSNRHGHQETIQTDTTKSVAKAKSLSTFIGIK